MCFINFNGTKVCGHYIVKNTNAVKREKAVVKRNRLLVCILSPTKVVGCWRKFATCAWLTLLLLYILFGKNFVRI